MNPQAVRKRLGLVVPSTNITTEPEFWTASGTDVPIHTARVQFDDPPDPQDKAAAVLKMNRGLEDAIRSLLQTGPSVIGYACTTASFMQGDEADREVCTGMSKQYGIPFVTAARALGDGLSEAGISKIALFTVYSREVMEQQVSFLEEQGILVVSAHTRPLVSAAEKQSMSASAVAQEVAEMRLGTAEAVFVSCTNIPTFSVLPAMRKSLGKPVHSSNSLLLARMMKLADSQPGEPL